jgi:hypothetical protein
LAGRSGSWLGVIWWCTGLSLSPNLIDKAWLGSGEDLSRRRTAPGEGCFGRGGPHLVDLGLALVRTAPEDCFGRGGPYLVVDGLWLADVV